MQNFGDEKDESNQDMKVFGLLLIATLAMGSIGEGGRSGVLYMRDTKGEEVLKAPVDLSEIGRAVYGDVIT